MRINEVSVEVRNAALERQGTILNRDLSLKAKLRWCGVGEWTLTLPQSHGMVPELLTKGSGLIVRGPRPEGNGVLFSGPTLVPSRKRDIKNPDGTLTFKGVTDDVLLEDALAFPSPGVADPAAQTAANDVLTGAAETLMRQYVSRNLVPGVAPAGRIRGFRSFLALSGADETRGAVLTKSPRFQNLLELLQEIATGSSNVALPGGIGFRVVQVDESLEFQVVSVRDQRDTVRLDINNGTITSEEVQEQGPSLTDAIVLGQGEGVDRQVVRRHDALGETNWHRPIERVFDRRDTNDVVELEQKGDEELLTATGGVSVKLVPADDQTMRYGFDWIEGDWVTAVVNGQETDSVITESVFLFDSQRVAMGAAIGDVTSFTPADAQKRNQQTLDSRIGYLERASAGPVAVDRLPKFDVRLSGTTAERDALFGVPGASVPAQVSLANQRVAWWNTELGWEESFYAVTGSAGLTVPGLHASVAAGWYPTGVGPYMTLQPTAGGAAAGGGYLGGWNGQTMRRGGAAWFTATSTELLINKPGLYDLSAFTVQQSGSGVAYYALRVLNAAGSVITAARENAAEPLLAAPYLAIAEYQFETTIVQPSRLMWFTVGGTLSVHQTAATAGVRGQMKARYLGPALVTD